MDVNLFVPVNVRVVDILADGYSITWELSAAARADLLTSPTAPAITVYGRNAITTTVGILGVVSAAQPSFIYAVPSGISEVYLTATYNGTETTASNSVTLLSTNAMPSESMTSIARDENGVARSLATTPEIGRASCRERV